MQLVAEIANKAVICMPIAGLTKELVCDASEIKASDAPRWTEKRRFCNINRPLGLVAASRRLVVFGVTT